MIAVLGGMVGGLLQFRVYTTIDSFLPSGDPSVAALQRQERSFGGDPIVVLLESEAPQQLLLDGEQLPRLLGLEGQLAQLSNVASVYGPATVLNQIATSSQNLLAQISGRRDALRVAAEQKARNERRSEQVIRDAGNQAVVEFDRRYGALLVKGLPAGLPTLSNPGFAKAVIYDESGAPRVQWHFVVPNKNTVAVLVRPRADLDQAGTKSLVAAIRKSVDDARLATSKTTIIGIPVIVSDLADEASEELPLLGALVAIAMLLRFLLAPARGSRLRRLWPLGAALVGSAMMLSVFGWLGVSISFGAAALLPLLLGVGSSFPLYLRTSVATRKVLVVSLASAASFAALAACPIPFVREIGLALAGGIVFTILVALVLRRTMEAVPTAADAGREPSTADRRNTLPRRTRWAVLAAVTAIAGFGWAILPSLDIDANPEQLAKGLPGLSEAQYAEQVLGSSGEVNVELRGPDVLSSESLAWARQAGAGISQRHGDDLRPVLALPDLLRFLGDSPTSSQIVAGIGLMPSYLTSAVLSPDGQAGVLIYGLKFDDLGSQSRLLDDVRAMLPPPPSGYRAEVVGLPVAAAGAYASVSENRYLLNLLGIVGAGAILFFGVRRRDALHAILAALLATGWALAAAWCLGVALSPLTIALGSLTAVTGCEFTVLLVDAYRRKRASLHRTILWACITSFIGYLTLVASQLWLLRQFGLVLTVTILFSYLAALVVVRLLPPRTKKPVPADDMPAVARTEVAV